MVLSTWKVHISYGACAVGSGSSNRPPGSGREAVGHTHCLDKPLKAASPQREGSVSHRHLGSGSNPYVIFFFKSHRFKCNRAPTREPLHGLWAL